MPWINSWQRAEAIAATEAILGKDAGTEEYNRVMEILERSFGDKSDAIRVATQALQQEAARKGLERLNEAMKYRDPAR